MTAPAPSDRTAGWSHFPHEADIGVRGWGPTVEAAFEQAALAMSAVITMHPVEPRESVAIRCAAPTLDVLLVEWLNAVVYEMAVCRMLFGRFSVRVAGTVLEGKATGERVDVTRHQPAVEVKGATYTGLRVEQDENGLWIAECVVDV